MSHTLHSVPLQKPVHIFHIMFGFDNCILSKQSSIILHALAYTHGHKVSVILPVWRVNRLRGVWRPSSLWSNKEVSRESTQGRWISLIGEKWCLVSREMKKKPHLWTATPLICRHTPVCVSPGYSLLHLWLKTTKFNKNNFKNQKAFGCKCQEEAINAVCVTFLPSRTKTTSNYHLDRKRKTNKKKTNKKPNALKALFNI